MYTHYLTDANPVVLVFFYSFAFVFRMRFHLYLFHVLKHKKSKEAWFPDCHVSFSFCTLFVWSRTIVVVAVRLNVIRARRDKKISLASEHIYFSSKSFFWRTKFVSFSTTVIVPTCRFPPNSAPPSRPWDILFCDLALWIFHRGLFSNPDLKIGPWNAKSGNDFFLPWPPFPIDFSVVGVAF